MDERQQRVTSLFRQLMVDIPADLALVTDTHAAKRLLANLLDWNRREEKAESHEYYRLKDLPEEELLYERSALYGLEYVERVEESPAPKDRYRYQPQETSIRDDNDVCQRGETFGKVVSIDLVNRLVDIKKTADSAPLHPNSVFLRNRFSRADACAKSIGRLAEWIIQNGVDADGQYRCGRDLLLRRPPRVIGQTYTPLVRDSETITDAAKRIVVSLDSSVLAIQGPPGSGKTFTGAKIICELLRRGKRVGITAVPHRVIRTLIEEVLVQAKQESLPGMACLHKVNKRSDGVLPSGMKESTDNGRVLKALQNGSATVIGGTARLWSREEMSESVDVLVVDEAGQMSLANVLASAQAAKSLVLLGDPQQLDQPLKGSHPPGADVSALKHVIGDASTIPIEKGLFLEHTRRLHPKICSFTSELFYSNVLHPLPGLDRQEIKGHPFFHAGLCFVKVDHEGNQNASSEEANVIEALVKDLLLPGVRWFDVKASPAGLVPLNPQRYSGHRPVQRAGIGHFATPSRH